MISLPGVRQDELLSGETRRRPNAALLHGATFVSLVLCGIPIDIGAQILPGEVGLAVVGAVLLGRTQLPRNLAVPFVLALLWLAALILSSYVAGDSPTDIISGTAPYCLFLIDTAALIFYISAVGRRAWPVLGSGLGLAALGYFILQGTAFYEAPWKFGFALPVTTLMLSIVGSRYELRSWQLKIAILALTIANIVGSFRSLALILLVSLFLVSIRLDSKKAVLGVVLGTAASIGVVTYSYGYVVEAGYLGTDSQVRFSQAVGDRYDPLRLLLGGRKELVLSLNMVAEHPLVGYGLDATLSDDANYEWRNYYYQNDLPLTISDLNRSMAGSPYRAHSALFSAWVQAGVLGAVFFGYLLLVSAYSLLGGLTQRLGLIPTFLVVFGIWSLLFSPMGSIGRILLGLCISPLPFALEHVRRRWL